MLGKQDPQRRLFETVNIEALVPAGHILRRLSRVIDYGFIRELVGPFYCARNGRPSYDPVLILKMLVIGRLYDFSNRQLCDEVAMHAGFRWFCGLGFEDDVPDHSTLTTTRDRWSANELAVWQGALDRVVQACLEVGLVSGKHLSIDGTEIRANAALKTLERIPEPLRMPGADPAGMPPAEPVAAPSTAPARPSESPAAAEARVETKDRKAGDENFRGERFSNTTHRSTTDPEAMLFRKGRGKEAKLAYLGHVVIDTKSRTILGADASPARSDFERTVGMELLSRLAANSDLPRIQSLAADKGYGTAAFIGEVAALGVEPHIPVPGSANLEEIPSYSRGPTTLMAARKRADRLHAVESRNLARRLMQTRRGKLSQRLRTRVEHVHAEAKQHHGLARARLRGLQKVRTEVKFTATVQNLKRLANRRRSRVAPGISQVAIVEIGSPKPRISPVIDASDLRRAIPLGRSSTPRRMARQRRWGRRTWGS